MSNAADIAKFTRSAKRVLRQIETYATTGGDTSADLWKARLQLAAKRDRLEDTMRPLGVTDEPSCVALMAEVRSAFAGCGDRADAARRAANDAELARIDAEIRDARAEDERKCPGITAYRAELRRSR